MDQSNGVTTATKALEPADLGASKPIPQPAEYKQRPVQHPTVVACGHKLDTYRLPVHANCVFCWEAFFESNSQHLGHVHDVLMSRGTKGLISVYGKKFTEYFGLYLKKQLLSQYASPAVQAASGIEGAQLEIPMVVAEEAQVGIR